MKYEFHVGDYVEMNDGRVGYINGIGENKDKCYIVWNPGFIKVGIGYSFDELIKGAVRIGQYDFTKPEQPKEIEKLPDGYGDGYVLYKGVTEVDGTVSNGWVSIGVLSNKINELVDAVNELRKDTNE